MSEFGAEIGRGTKVFDAAPVRGEWRMLDTPDDVLALMDTGADGVVAGVADAGATFLAPIFDELRAVVCLSGTPRSHIGIVSREYQVPCIMGSVLTRDAGRRRRRRGRLLRRRRRHPRVSGVEPSREELDDWLTLPRRHLVRAEQRSGSRSSRR